MKTKTIYSKYSCFVLKHFLERKPPYYLKVNYRACDRLIFKRNNRLVSIPGYVLQSCQELCARDQVFLSRLISRSHKLNPANMALFV